MILSQDSDGSRRKPAKYAGRPTTGKLKTAKALSFSLVNRFHNGLTLQQKKHLIGALAIFNIGLFGATLVQDNASRAAELRSVEAIMATQPARNSIVIQPVTKPDAISAQVESVEATPTPTPTPTPTATPTPAPTRPKMVAGASISRVAGDKQSWMQSAGIPQAVWGCVDALVTKESGWRINASNPSSGAYGLPQALPGSKMASAGADWATNPVTQLRWMHGYVNGRYGGFCQALAFQQSNGWY